jgi:hypothetical protein
MKTRIDLGIVLSIALVVLLAFQFLYKESKKALQAAYKDGYYAGYNSDMASLAFVESSPDEFNKTGQRFKYVGIGNERGKRYWWSR